MFSINPAGDPLPGDIRLKNVLKKNLYNLSTGPEDESTLERKKLYHTCAIQEVGLVAMKPYAGGVLFRENPSSIILTPVQCINYALSQPGVCTVVPGCKNVTEMKAALAFLDATDDEKDYSTINVNSIWKLRGSCMYCNHCLPCPVGIDIGTIIRLTDTAIYGSVENIALEYEILLSKASHCTECGVCMERCPFGVDVVANITRAVEIFGK
jgi:hypothetical protein